MKKIIAALFVTAALVTIFLIAKNYSHSPKGWFPAGSNPSQYEMGTDNSTFQDGKTCAFIKSKSPGERQFGTLMQTINANDYSGKRIQLSGYIKSQDVKEWTGMWMRIDGDNFQQHGFDNMQNRPVTGTNNWKIYSIVLDVPEDSKTINYGVLLAGKGEVWFDNLQLKEVDKSVPVTNLNMSNNFMNGKKFAFCSCESGF